MLQGLIMDMPLMISSAIQHAAEFHGGTEIVARDIDGTIHRSTYAEAHRRTKRLANALGRLGVRPGDRIGTLGWNTHRHFELFYGVSGSGAVLHPVNPRLFADQIVYIVNHAEDTWLFIDAAVLSLAEQLAPRLKSVKGFVLRTLPVASTRETEVIELTRNVPWKERLRPWTVSLPSTLLNVTRERTVPFDATNGAAVSWLTRTNGSAFVATRSAASDCPSHERDANATSKGPGAPARSCHDVSNSIRPPDPAAKAGPEGTQPFQSVGPRDVLNVIKEAETTMPPHVLIRIMRSAPMPCTRYPVDVDRSTSTNA